MLLPIAILLLSLTEIEESAPIDYLSTETVAPFLLLISELGTTAEFTDDFLMTFNLWIEELFFC